MTLIVMGAIKALAILIILARMDIRKFLGYPVILDSSVTIIIAALMFGTYSGVMVAAIAGIMFSLFVTILRGCYGYKRIRLINRKFQWVEYPPTFKFVRRMQAAHMVLKEAL